MILESKSDSIFTYNICYTSLDPTEYEHSTNFSAKTSGHQNPYTSSDINHVMHKGVFLRIAHGLCVVLNFLQNDILVTLIWNKL